MRHLFVLLLAGCSTLDSTATCVTTSAKVGEITWNEQIGKLGTITALRGPSERCTTRNPILATVDFSDHRAAKK